MKSKFRIVETANGFWVQEYITESKLKMRKSSSINTLLILFGFIGPYAKEREDVSKWMGVSIHGGSKTFPMWRCFDPFKTLEEAKVYAKKLIKYEKPIIHEI